MKAQVQKLGKKLAKYIYVLLLITLSIGFLVGYMVAPRKINKTGSTSNVRTVSLLIHNGESARNWNNLTLTEGESVLDLVERVAKIEGVDISTTGEGKDRTINTLMNKSSSMGEWKYYINNANPLPTIGRFFPKDTDVISVLYVQK